MEGSIGVGLQVVGCGADTGVSHNGAARARLPGRVVVAVAARAATRVAIKWMVTSKLVPHFVGHVVDIESIAHGVG